MMERFSHLRRKEVINICDGRRLGFVGDLELKVPEGEVKALIVFGPCRFFGLFGRGEDFYVPWDCVQRFGDDIIAHRQALPAAGGGQKAPPLGLSRDNTAKKPLIFRESRKKSLANSYRLWYDISAFRTAADFRSVPQGWPGGGSVWR